MDSSNFVVARKRRVGSRVSDWRANARRAAIEAMGGDMANASPPHYPFVRGNYLGEENGGVDSAKKSEIAEDQVVCQCLVGMMLPSRPLKKKSCD